jgi:hypothetical protein
VLLADILDAKVVNNQGENNGAGVVGPLGRRESDWAIAGLG